MNCNHGGEVIHFDDDIGGPQWCTECGSLLLGNEWVAPAAATRTHSNGRLIPIAQLLRDSPLTGAVSATTIYRFAREGKIPGVVRLGRRVYMTRAALRSFLSHGGVQ